MENGEVHFNKSVVNGRYPVDTTALIQCNAGYTIPGPSTRICQSSKNWNGQEPTCEGKINLWTHYG